MKTMNLRPLWAQKVCQLLTERNMTKKELAEKLRISYNLISTTLSGYANNDKVKQAILCYFDMYEDMPIRLSDVEARKKHLSGA